MKKGLPYGCFLLYWAAFLVVGLGVRPLQRKGFGKMRRILVAAVLAAAVSVSGATLSFRSPAIVPGPRELTYDETVAVRLNGNSTIAVTCPDAAAEGWVRDHAKSWFACSPKVVQKVASAGIDHEEGYTLAAKAPGTVEIGAKTLQGVRYAMHSLRQAAERESRGSKLVGYWMPEFSVKDAPALAFRGVHFCWFPEQSATLIEHQIRLAAYYKFNYAVLESWGVFRSERHPELGLKDGPLTVAEAKRLAALAKDLGLTLIPQINIYGHATQARGMGGKHIVLDYHPGMQPLYEPGDGWNWCLSNPDATAVVRDLVDELHEAFGRPPFFHVGGDEAFEPTCPTCRSVKPYGKLVAAHFKAVHDLLKSRGARMMMWHDMLLVKGSDPRWKEFYANGRPENAGLLDELPRDTVICDWYYGGYTAKPKDPDAYPTIRYFREKGFDVVTCPWENQAGIRSQGAFACATKMFGFLETVWHHYSGKGFQMMMRTSADAAWGGKSKGGQAVKFHWRQAGWDMGIDSYKETGFYDATVSRNGR